MVGAEVVLSDGRNRALVTGNWTFGQVAARFATERAIEIARDHGVAVVGLVQCHHVGRLGHYSEMAADEKLIAEVWAGGYSEEAPAAAPFGGRGRLLHTSPLSIGFPEGNELRLMFDFATTTVSGVKIEDARRRGHLLPPNAIVDREGRPSIDPNDFFDGGAHVPFGGHKGYALSMAAEFIGRILTGSATYADPDRAGPVLRSQGVTFVVMRADLFRPLADFEREVDEMERRTRAASPAAGFDEVLVPGDPEWRSRQQRRASGIPIEAEIWRRIEVLPR